MKHIRPNPGDVTWRCEVAVDTGTDVRHATLDDTEWPAAAQAREHLRTTLATQSNTTDGFWWGSAQRGTYYRDLDGNLGWEEDAHDRDEHDPDASCYVHIGPDGALVWRPLPPADGYALATAVDGQWRLTIMDESRTRRLHGPEAFVHVARHSPDDDFLAGVLPDGWTPAGPSHTEPHTIVLPIRRTPTADANRTTAGS